MAVRTAGCRPSAREGQGRGNARGARACGKLMVGVRQACGSGSWQLGLGPRFCRPELPLERRLAAMVAPGITTASPILASPLHDVIAIIWSTLDLLTLSWGTATPVGRCRLEGGFGESSQKIVRNRSPRAGSGGIACLRRARRWLHACARHAFPALSLSLSLSLWNGRFLRYSTVQFYATLLVPNLGRDTDRREKSRSRSRII